MIGRTNAGGGGAPNKSTIIVAAPMGSTVTCSMGTTTKTAAEKNGTWTFSGLDNGTWTITATLGAQTSAKTVEITRLTVEYVTISYSTIPEFTYTGDYEIVDDADTPITTSDGNWKIRFLTSGVFTPTDLRGAADGIDVFLVGGGSGGKNNQDDYSTGVGGGGGKTETVRNFQITANTAYSITIGAGGSPNKNGGQTIAFGSIVDGGVGKHGGSGGGCIGHAGYSDGGGYDDSEYDGGDPEGSLYPGTGQGTTTREFGDIGGTLYSAGGGAGDYWNVDEETNRESVKPGDDSAGTGALSETIAATAGKANRGGGGGGGSNKKANAAPGGSGIVIIRNARGVA